MVGTDAWSHIAFMKDAKTIGNIAVKNFPGYSMRDNVFAINTHAPIPTNCLGSGPQPASFRFFDVLPKIFLWSSDRDFPAFSAFIAGLAMVGNGGITAHAFSKIGLHVKGLLSCAMPPAATTARRFFIEEILA
jgi:hypothetical protein